MGLAPGSYPKQMAKSIPHATREYCVKKCLSKSPEFYQPLILNH
jgi:hypothetical protein